MKGIDMSKVFASASSIEKPLRLVCDYIDADKLKVHPENERIYGKLEVDDLVTEIARAGGVKEPVEVVKKGDDLCLIAGHRRQQATLIAFEKGLIKSKKIPYIVSEFKNSDEEIFALIGRNTQRHKTAQIRQNEIAEITRLLKKNKASIKGSFRTYVANYLGISETDLQRYWDYEKLAGCIKKGIENKQLTFSAACEFASLSKKEQEGIFKELQKRDQLMVKDIRKAKKEIKNGQQPVDKTEKTISPQVEDTVTSETVPVGIPVEKPKGMPKEPAEEPAIIEPSAAAKAEKLPKPKQPEKEVNLEASAIEYCISILQEKRAELDKTDPSGEELRIIACQDYLDKLISNCQKELQAIGN